MTDDQLHAAAALIKWFKSQQIDPEEAIPIMAMAMCIASIRPGADLKSDVIRVNKSASLVMETLIELMENPTKFKEGLQ